MSVDLFRAAAPAALSTLTGIFIGYIVFNKFIASWYGESKNSNKVAWIKYWLGVISCISIAEGITKISGEFFYLAFNDGSIRGDNIFKGLVTFIVLPLILSVIGYIIGFLFGNARKDLQLTDDEHYAAAMHEINNNTQKDGLWARCLVNSDGNDGKAKSEYIRLRATEISQSTLNKITPINYENSYSFEGSNENNNKSFFRTVFYILIVFGFWVYLISYHTKSDNELGNYVRNILNINHHKRLPVRNYQEPSQENRILLLAQEDGTGKGLTLYQVREKYPAYIGVSDAQLSEKLYQKYYSSFKRSDVNAVLFFELKID